MNPNQAVDQMTSKDVDDNLHYLDCPTTQLIPKMMYLNYEEQQHQCSE